MKWWGSETGDLKRMMRAQRDRAYRLHQAKEEEPVGMAEAPVNPRLVVEPKRVPSLEEMVASHKRASDRYAEKRYALKDYVMPGTEGRKDDTVNHPSHYTTGGIECYDAMAAMLSTEEMIGYLRGNSFKYRWRFRHKNGIEDLRKAEWYEKKLAELINDRRDGDAKFE